jgi:hypothetical protein
MFKEIENIFSKIRENGEALPASPFLKLYKFKCSHKQANG